MGYLNNTGLTHLKDTLDAKYASKSAMTGASANSAGAAGLVPAPSSGDESKVLLGSGTWAQVKTINNESLIGSGNITIQGGGGSQYATDIEMSASDPTTVAAAIAAVPKTDFIGASSFATGAHGLVPAPAAGDQDKVLKGDGSWGAATVPDMTGATSSAAGTHGLVPAPGSATLPQLFYLSSNGAFRAPIATRSMITSGDIVYEQFSTISATSSRETGVRLYTARKVLWENASPSSNFAAQTITLSEDVGNYLFWGIECYIINTGAEKVSFMFVGQNAGRLTATALTTNSNKSIARSMSIDSTGTQLTFGAGYYNNDVSAGRMVPSKVYGFYRLS